MRVAVVSSDTFTEADLSLLDEVCLSSRYCCTEVVALKGLGGHWAKSRRLPVLWVSAVEQIPREADAVVALWDGKSADIASLIRMARSGGLLVYARVAAPRGNAKT